MMSSDDAARLVKEAFEAALSGDSAGAGERIALLGRDSTRRRMFGICAAIASTVPDALRTIFAGRVPDPAKGEQWYVMHLRPPLNRIRKGSGDTPPHLFSERYIVAYLNDDRDNQQALYGAALAVPGDHFARCVAALFADAVGLCALAGGHVEGRGR